MSICEIKTQAKSQIKGKIGSLFLIMLIYLVIAYITGFMSVFTLGISVLLVSSPMIFGYLNVYLKLVSTSQVEVSTLFSGFKIIWKSIGAQLLQGIYIFLWSMLFFVPGIIKTFSYAMTNYIILENPEIGLNEAITRSREMMHGNKMKLFLLQLSFIGWLLLIPFTFGMISIYVVPYMQTATVNFYNSIKFLKNSPIVNIQP